MKSSYALRNYTDLRDFPFSVVSLTHTGTVDSHDHDFTELVIVLGGSAAHRMDGEEYPLRHGDVFTVPERGRHGYRNADALELVNIMFDLEAFLRANPELKGLPGFYSLFYLEPRFRKDHRFQSRLTLRPEDLDFAASLARLLGEEFRGRSEGYRPAIRTYLHALLVFLSRRFCGPQNPSVQSVRMHRMAESLSYLERHYRQDLSVARLAELACLSPRQYDRVFKSLYNTSPKSYMIGRRLEHARALLEKGTMDAGSIAMECGFSSPSHFSRQFKARYGTSPRAYRIRAGSSDTMEERRR